MQQYKLWKIAKIYTWKLDANAKVDLWQYPFFTCAKEISWINDFAYDCECILVAWNWDLNVKYYNWKFNAYQRTYIIENNYKEKVFMKYIYYLLDNYVEKLRDQTIWWVIKYIKLNNLTDIIIPLPPISTQKSIAEKLDKIQSMIDLKKQAITKIDELVKSIFINMFGDPLINPKGWEVKKLNELIEEFKYWTSEKSSNEWLPVLRIPNIVNWIDLTDLKYCKLLSKENEKYFLKKWDILFVRTNWNPNFVWRNAVFNLDWNYIFASYLIRTRIKQNIVSPIYLTEFLKMPFGMNEIKKKIKTSAWQYNINTEWLWDLTILLPPLSLQQKFADIIIKIEEQKQNHQQSLAKLEELYNTTMQESFRLK